MLNAKARFIQFLAKSRQKFNFPPQTFHFSTRYRRGQHIGAQLNTVCHNRMSGPMQPVHPLDGDGGGAMPVNLRAHGNQAFGEINDLWLTRRLF